MRVYSFITGGLYLETIDEHGKKTDIHVFRDSRIKTKAAAIKAYERLEEEEGLRGDEE